VTPRGAVSGGSRVRHAAPRDLPPPRGRSDCWGRTGHQSGASVHTSGVVTNAPLVGRWTFEDGTILDEKTDSITTTGDARTIFFIVKPSGFGTGKYSLHVLIDGKEVSTRDAAVK